MIVCTCATDFVLPSVIFFVSIEEFLYLLYSSLKMRDMIHNLNNNRKMNNFIIVTVITTKATNGGIGGRPRKK
jgi:hypothetical protein